MNKINNKTLVALLGILLIIFAFTKIIGSDGDKTFKETLYSIDTTAIDKVVITPKLSSKKDPFTLQKIDGQWMALQGDVKDEMASNMINSILGPFQEMKPTRLVALKEEQWKKYEVNDSLGTIVQVYSGEDEVANLVVSKFNFQNRTRSVSNFVRPAEEDKVYAVEGMLSSTYGQDFNSYRNKSFLKFNPKDIRTIRFNYPADSSFVLSKFGDQWQIKGQAVDSTTTANFLSKISNKTMTDFEDEFNSNGQSPLFKVTFEGDNMAAIEVSCYEDENLAYIMHSSQNRNSFFTGGTINLFEELFVSSSKFLELETQ